MVVGDQVEKKKGKQETVKIIITGFLIVLFCIIIGILFSVIKSVSCIKYFMVGIIPTLMVIYFILAGLLYLLGMVVDAKTKPKVRFWAKAFLAAGIIAFVLAIIAPALPGEESCLPPIYM